MTLSTLCSNISRARLQRPWIYKCDASLNPRTKSSGRPNCNCAHNDANAAPLYSVISTLGRFRGEVGDIGDEDGDDAPPTYNDGDVPPGENVSVIPAGSDTDEDTSRWS